MILIAILYFVIILFVIMSPIKPQKLINSEIRVSEVNTISNFE